jgi:hypothetical protein
MPLAIYNFGMFRTPAESPINQGFRDREPVNFEAAARAPGFIARSGYPDEPGPQSWGEQVYPRFYIDRGDGWAPSTLSLWTDLESLMAFAYSGVHAEALKHASDWFMPKAWPPYVIWWVPAAHRPDWQEAVARFERLHDLGPTPEAFTFKSPFDAQGRPTTIKRPLALR